VLGPDRAAKEALEQRFDRWIDESLAGFVAPSWAPRVFSYELDDAVIAHQRDEYLDEPVFVPELWATHRLIERLFEGPLRASSPADADVCYLPLFLPAFEVAERDLRPTIQDLELVGSGRPHIVTSLWDGYPRPPSRRANPFSMQSLGHVMDPAGLDEAWSWLDDRWRVLTLCSSIDVDPADVSLFPLVAPEPAPESAPNGGRPLLYSFCGATAYEHVPSDHVRGRAGEATWERLAQTGHGDMFVGSMEAARLRFGSEASYRSMPGMSRFTLCPAGWSRWSFRIYEAISAGSIPVVLSDYSVLPFSDQLEWDRFALFLPEVALGEIDDILRSLSPQRVAALSAGVVEARRHLTPAGLALLLIRSLAGRPAEMSL
jgi:hypothetical protein